MTQQATARPLPRTRTRPAPTPRRLRVVAPPAAEGNGLFLGLCVLLLLGGFVGVLMLNTAMAKGSYTMRDLQRRSDALTDTQDDLRHALDAVSGPGPLAREARSLGMVPAQSAAFLRLSDGKVLGVAKAATANEQFSVVTEGQGVTKGAPVSTTTPTPTASPSPVPSTRPKATPSPRASTTPAAGAKATPTPKPTGH
jgi:hypothetical protein